ncbi:hypothetical protein HBB16_04895 [Pseudonocardia sp. MCCB 268]|nr:hypothetical protein [Pseudonocardia cytotoxica]
MRHTGGTPRSTSASSTTESRVHHDTWLGGTYLGHLTGLSGRRPQHRRGWRVDRLGRSRRPDAGRGRTARAPSRSRGSFGRGGTAPTVTDAATVLGYSTPRPSTPAGCGLTSELPPTAIGTVADQLGLRGRRSRRAPCSLHRANEHMVRAIQELTVTNEGADPWRRTSSSPGRRRGLNTVAIMRESAVSGCWCRVPQAAQRLRCAVPLRTSS